MTHPETVDTTSEGVADSDAPGFSLALVSLSGLVGELRRRWLLIACTTVIGGLLAAVLVTMTGGGATATTTLILGQNPSTDRARAIETDLQLLKTRVLAAQVISSQGLDLTVDELQSAVTASAPSTQLVTMTVSAADGDQAVGLASALASTYLDFRADVLTQQAEAAAQGNEELAASLSGQVDEITRQVDQLSGSTDEDDVARLNELVATRASLNSQIEGIRQDLRADQITLAAVIGSSGVVDPAMVDPEPGRLAAALILATGLVGGLVAGVAIVLGSAILVDRPRRRSAISKAIGAPILLSVGKVRGRHRPARRSRRVLSMKLSDWVTDRRWGSRRLAILSVDSEKETLDVAAALIRSLERRGVSVTAIDLTVAGGLGRRVGVSPTSLDDWRPGVGDGKAAGTRVIRPTDVPDIRRPPASFGVNQTSSPMHPSAESLVIVVGQVTAALGAEHLAEWAMNALLVLRAGAVGSEQLTGAATVVRRDGMRLIGGILTNADRADVSVGEPPLPGPGHLERVAAVPR